LKVSGLGVPARRRRPGPHPVAHIGLCHWPFQSRPGNRRNQPRRTASLRGHRPADRGPGDRRELPGNDRIDPGRIGPDCGNHCGRVPAEFLPQSRSRLQRPWTDESFSCPAPTVDQSLSKYIPTYSYEFADQNAPERYEPPVDFSYGARHDSEVQYLFDQSNTPLPGFFQRASSSW